jgi:hypothetical protein
LVLDVERYRYQRFISDIAGQDIAAHKNDVETAITKVRDWLRLELDPSLFKTPSGSRIYARYQAFEIVLTGICSRLGWDINDLPFADFSWAVYEWITSNPIP